MDRISEIIEGEVTSSGLALQEFCDMEQLYKLLENWSKSCGMATVIIDNEGNQVSEDFGMTEFCKTVQSCGKGLAGQALSVNQNEEDILKKTSELGTDNEKPIKIDELLSTLTEILKK